MENLIIEPITYDFSQFKDIEEEARKLLPEKTPDIIQFDIKCNSRIANAIRRTLLDEIKTKSLEPGNILTNDIYIIKDELINNIRQIPIDQSVSLDTRFSIAVENKNTHIVPVYTKKIRSDTTDTFNSRIQICTLNPGKRLQIKNMTIVEGRGRNNSRFSPVSVVSFKMLDFIEVGYLNTKNKIESYILPIEDVQRIAKTKSVMDKRIVIIPTKTQQTLITDKLKKRILKYDIVVEPNDKLKLDKLHNYQSTEYHSKYFRIRARTLGTIKPLKLLDLCYSTILQELNFILKMKGFAVEVTNSKDVYHFHLKNTTYTLGEAINYTVYEMNPDIPLCNETKLDPVSNNITINIKHTTAEDIFKAAVVKLIDDFTKLHKSIPKIDK